MLNKFMFKGILWSVVLLLSGWFLAQHVQAQTTNGLLTGTITDPGGAIVPGAQITAANQATGETRTAVTTDLGVWLIPQVPPGIYKVTAAKQGFATLVQQNVKLDVNGSVTLNLQLKVGATSETIQVSTAPPLLDTTSATISTVVGHQEVVDLPLNGREFTQLALLSPGAAPVESAQQTSFAIPEGSGGISPSTDGQRGEENNFTIDGIENNELFDNAWAISPPPDAIQEFNVQAHMADAQYGVSSGGNINVQTRTGTNNFHGDAWEFVRNTDFDATTYPNPTRPFYHQNQFGFFVGGPIIKNHTFFSGYWDQYRFSQASVQFGNTLTTGPNGETSGDFAADVGTTIIGTDDLGRPEYANEIYDATTSRLETSGMPNPGLVIRDPFPAATDPGASPGSQVPASYISAQATAYLSALYPAPNYTGATKFPNYTYSGASAIKGNQAGARFDQQLGSNDSAFVRFARNRISSVTPGAFPTYPGANDGNFANEVELGYTHIFDPKTILNVRAAYVYENLTWLDGLTNDPTLTAAMGTQLVNVPRLGANVPIFGALGNGITEVVNIFNPLGPSSFFEYNVDVSKTMGHHTVSAGGMFFPLRQVADVVILEANASQAGSSVNGETSGQTGFGPASFLQGIVDDFYTYNLLKNLDLTVPWWAFYGQDQWQVNKKLVLTFGTRWDYIAPENYHRPALVFDPLTGKMWGVGTIPTSPSLTALLPVGDPTLHQAGNGYFISKKNGWEPRFGATYQIRHDLVGHLAFSVIDQHDNQLCQGNENIALNWPNGDYQNQPNLDTGIPQMYLSTLPTEASLLGAGHATLGGSNAAIDTPISYVMEFNAGVQQQLADNLTLNLDYVGSLGRHQWVTDTANTAETPGPGSQQARAQYPQYPAMGAYGTQDPTSYNGLQAKLVRPFAAGVTFTASYTWSKSLDNQSDPYNGPQPNWYHAISNWGPSLYDVPQLFVFSGVYQLPFGTGRQFMQTPNKFIQEVLGNWQTAGILSLHDGTPFYVGAGTDIANTGWSFQPAQRGSLSPYTKAYGGAKGLKQWLTPPCTPTSTPACDGTTLPDSSSYAFTDPLPYTMGNERRDDLRNPGYTDVDFDIQKNFPIWESANFQFRAEFFNIFNHTNYGGTGGSANTPGGFGLITSASAARVIQLSGKINF